MCVCGFFGLFVAFYSLSFSSCFNFNVGSKSP